MSSERDLNSQPALIDVSLDDLVNANSLDACFVMGHYLPKDCVFVAKVLYTSLYLALDL